jgi:hypothetical protein
MRRQCVSPIEVIHHEGEATTASGQMECKEGMLGLGKRLFLTFYDV